MDLAPQVKPTMVNHPRWRMKQFRFEKCKYHQDVPMLCIYGNWSTKPMRTPFVEYILPSPNFYQYPIPQSCFPNCKFLNDSDKYLKLHLIIRGTFEMCGTWKIGPREASAMYCPQGIAMLLQKCNIWLLLAISPLGSKILCQYSHLVKI